jgi:HAD superfamily hydrolase (TIGR01509 family)
MLEAVLFDNDGVLVDSERVYCRAVQEAFRPYGVEITQDEFVRRWMIDQTKTAGAVRDYGLEDKKQEIQESKSQLLSKYIDEIEMMPGAWHMLERFYWRGHMALVSSDSRRNVNKKLGNFGLETLFDVIVTANDVKNSKPHPEPYQKALERLGVSPSDALVIEDNPSGVKSAKAVKPEGCKVIAFPNGFTRDMAFPGADKIVYSLDEINEKMIEELFPGSGQGW